MDFFSLSKREAQLIFLSALPALGIFITFSILYDLPLIYDDYRYLHASLSEDFKFSDLGPFISRSPFFAVMLFILLKLDFLQSSFWFFLNLFFVFHVLTVGLVILYLAKSTGLNDIIKEKKYQAVIFCSIFILSFFPNFLELILWPHATTFFVGGFFMALGLHSKSAYIKGVLFFLAYATYEAFIIPSIVLSVIPYIIRFNSSDPFQINWKLIGKEILIFSIALLSYIILRLILGEVYGQFNNPVELPTWNSFLKLLIQLYEIRNHTDTWEFRTELFVLITILLILVIKRPLNMFFIAVLLILLISSGILYTLIPYLAYRVIYGSYLLRCGIIAIGLILIVRHFRLNVSLILLFLLFTAYLPSHIRTWRIRNYDNAMLERYKGQMERIIKNTDGQATIVMGDYSKNLRPYDWVIPPNSQGILDLFEKQININKPVHFILLGKQREKHLPLIFPACFLERTTGTVVPDWSSFSGEAVLTTPADSIGVIAAVSAINLDSGNYKVALKLKCGDFINESEEIADLEITLNEDKKIIASKKLYKTDFGSSNYQTFEIHFFLSDKEQDIEIKVQYLGKAWVLVDVISLHKITK